MDPGNWATDLAGGSQFGYTLLSVILLSNLMAVLLQGLASKLGIVTGRDLAQACRDHYSRAGRLRALGALRDRHRRVRPRRGDRLGDRAQPAVPHPARRRRAASPRSTCCSCSTLQNKGFRVLEALVITLVATVGLCFLFEIILAQPGRRRRAARASFRRREIVTRPRDALRRHRHPRRDGDAAQPLSALVDRADAAYEETRRRASARRCASRSSTRRSRSRSRSSSTRRSSSSPRRRSTRRATPRSPRSRTRTSC